MFAATCHAIITTAVGRNETLDMQKKNFLYQTYLTSAFNITTDLQ